MVCSGLRFTVGWRVNGLRYGEFLKLMKKRDKDDDKDVCIKLNSKLSLTLRRPPCCSDINFIDIGLDMGEMVYGNDSDYNADVLNKIHTTLNDEEIKKKLLEFEEKTLKKNISEYEQKKLKEFEEKTLKKNISEYEQKKLKELNVIKLGVYTYPNDCNRCT